MKTEIETSYLTIKKQLEKQINEGKLTIEKLAETLKTHPNNITRRFKNQRWQNDEVIIMRELGLII